MTTWAVVVWLVAALAIGVDAGIVMAFFCDVASSPGERRRMTPEQRKEDDEGTIAICCIFGGLAFLAVGAGGLAFMSVLS